MTDGSQACATTTSPDGSASPSCATCSIASTSSAGRQLRPGPGDARQARRLRHDIDYRLTDLGVALPSRRPVIPYCVDWSEQRHHLSGPVGPGLLTRLHGLGWIRRSKADRAVALTPAGRSGLAEHFDLGWPLNNIAA
jgi:hypothetical protein